MSRYACIFLREGNGHPLQCSCLENPRDRGAWWAAVSGVAQSRTRLKRLSSSSSIFLQTIPHLAPGDDIREGWGGPSYLPQQLTLPLLQGLLVSRSHGFDLRLHHLCLHLHLLRHRLGLLDAQLQNQKQSQGTRKTFTPHMQHLRLLFFSPEK